MEKEYKPVEEGEKGEVGVRFAFIDVEVGGHGHKVRDHYCPLNPFF